MATRSRAQMAMDETLVEDQTIESALEERQAAKDEVAKANAELRTADNRAKVALERLELPIGGVARVGRFRISREMTEERSVRFTTEAKDRVTIGLIKSEE